MRLSISKIKTFKSCRRLYELHYVEGLSPIKTAEALEVGRSYHKLLEQLYRYGEIEEGLSREYAMAAAYQKYIYPRFHVQEVENWKNYALGDGDVLVGVPDGIADDGHLVEHKTCGKSITEQYEYELAWDEQILAYMLMTGTRQVWYTVCQKPTIRQKKNETDEEFFQRMVAWYDEDTESKIRLLELTRTDEEVEEFKRSLFELRDVMKEAEKNKAFYKNTCHCDKWGRMCDYASVCLHYDPSQQYIEYEKEDREV